MLAIWSLVPLPFLKPAWTSESSRFTYCWSLAWRILSITILICEMSATVRWFEHSLALPFLGIGMKTDLFQSCGHCWVFQIPKWIPWPNDWPSVLVTHSNEPSLAWPRMNPVLKSKTGLLLYRCILLSCLLFHCTILAFSFSKLASSKRAHRHRHHFLHPSKENDWYFWKRKYNNFDVWGVLKILCTNISRI